MTPDQLRELDAVDQMLETGRIEPAARRLGPLMIALPNEARVHWRAALMAQMVGDFAACEQALRTVMRLDRRSAPPAAALGDLLIRQSRIDEAMAAWSEALERDPEFAPAAGNLAQRLIDRDDPRGALAVLAKLPPIDKEPGLLTIRGQAKAALGDRTGAMSDFRNASRMGNFAEGSHLLLAHSLTVIGEHAEAEAVARRGLQSQPEWASLWQILGEAIAPQGRRADAEEAFDKAIALEPDHAGAHGALAQMLWTATGDVAVATARLDAAIARNPKAWPLIGVKAQILDLAGRRDEALTLLGLAVEQADAPPYLLNLAAETLLAVDPTEAVNFATRSTERLPTDSNGWAALAKARLAAGDTDGAETAARKVLVLAPRSRQAEALLGTIARLRSRAGDAGPEAPIATGKIDVPEGWPSPEAYLADLKTALEALHAAKAPPVGQSIRGGSQVDLRTDGGEHPALAAFFQAIDAPIRDYIASLGEPADYRLSGAWSVRLAKGGQHVDHVHDNGWISSAFYVSLPPSVAAEGVQGRLRIGRPGVPTQPPLPAERWIDPEPGLLVLFPASTWHGVEPFDDDEPRLTIAFDVVRA